MDKPINFKAGRAAVQAKRDRESAFNALPLIEQIRIVVREEVRQALSDRSQWERMSPAEQQLGRVTTDQASWSPERVAKEVARQSGIPIHPTEPTRATIQDLAIKADDTGVFDADKIS